LTADARDLPPGQTRGEPLAINFEGQTIRAFAGESVAVALWAADVRTLGRSSKYHRPRGAFCLEGHCASCYLRIDGRPNRRACMTPVHPDLRCERQNAFPSVDVDVLMAADWLFPRGMDHHTLMTGSRVANKLFLKLVRQMGGSGTLPDQAPPALKRPDDETVDLCIVGGGPAGLAAARAAAETAPGARIVLFDEQTTPGGSLLAEPAGTAAAAALARAATAAGARLVSGATAIAFYPEDGAGILAVATEDKLVRVSARRYLYATGAYDQNLPFFDNDRPGIISARACGRLVFHHGVRPAAKRRSVVVLHGSPYAARLAEGLAAAGIKVEVVDLALHRVVAARGVKVVRGVDVESHGENNQRTVKGDLVAVGVSPAPASELPRQHGAPVVLDPARGGFAVQIDPQFACGPGVHACGDVTGFAGPQAALDAGQRAGQVIGKALR
jgi:sarcosine oxidase subunit alpha